MQFFFQKNSYEFFIDDSATLEAQRDKYKVTKIKMDEHIAELNESL